MMLVPGYIHRSDVKINLRGIYPKGVDYWTRRKPLCDMD